MSMFELNRRHFLAGAGSLFLSSISAHTKEAIHNTDTLLASCVKHPDGGYGAVLLDHKLEVIKNITLPDRGHDIVFSPITGKAVAFARRPGNFAVIFDANNNSEPRVITAPEGRHFYGHGAFSLNGQLLYASENDYENAIGKVGIYDATQDFKRIDEFNSFGIGPHEILLLDNGITLVIANGGIETHPDFGRTKLNLATMQSSIVFIDVRDGSLIESHSLPSSVHKLSLRHMAKITKDSIVFGGQHQGSKQDRPQLIGTCKLGDGLNFWKLPEQELSMFANYTGSIAVDPERNNVAISSPAGGVISIFNAHDGSMQSIIESPKENGLFYQGTKLLSSSEKGTLKAPHSVSKQYAFAFDNHLSIG